jgi:hypothetical protein
MPVILPCVRRQGQANSRASRSDMRARRLVAGRTIAYRVLMGHFALCDAQNAVHNGFA